MNYKQAVEAALQGNADAFSALYESTQNNMYYLALKYMKNPDDAKDVLQDAYIKAWQSLPTLKDPEHFPAWLGRIVANTAKNMLVKKKPDLFSDLEKENEDGDEFVFQIEDENTSYQPELNYTQKETQILVRELIDSLSDEQRFCILMYHLEGQSIKEIAETLDVSENTVKSRLNYGRKALKNKAEELKKKGYQLYSIAPLPLLLYLLRSESKSPAFTHAAKTVMLSRKETHARANGNPLALDIAPVVQRRLSHGHAVQINRFDMRNGRQLARAAHIPRHVADDGRRLLRLKLERNRPARETVGVAHHLAGGKVADLDEHAVNQEVEAAAFLLDVVDTVLNFADAPALPQIRADLKAVCAQEIKHPLLRGVRRIVNRANLIKERIEMA